MPPDALAHVRNAALGADVVAAEAYRRLLERVPALEPTTRLWPTTGLLDTLDTGHISGWSRLPFAGKRFKLFGLFQVMEQAPERERRITLSSRKDRFGQPLPRLHWFITEREQESMRRTQGLLGAAFARAGIGRLVTTVDLAGEDDVMRYVGPSAHHHLGTTRMHPDPEQGVVDENCRIHGTSNLYACGTSVFPTGGYINPTLTVVALATRLAGHIRTALQAEGRAARTRAVPPDPLVSICMPTFNSETWLTEAIESALDQTWEDFELVISDNASTDGTLEIARSFSDSRIRLEAVQPEPRPRAQPQPAGRALSRNVRQVPPRRRRPDADVRRGDGEPCARGRPHRARLRARGRSSTTTRPAKSGRERFRAGTSTSAHSSGSTRAARCSSRSCRPGSGRTGSGSRRACSSSATRSGADGLFNPYLRQIMDLEFWLRVMLSYRVGFIDSASRPLPHAHGIRNRLRPRA